jgi:hypothetical protein
MARLFKTKLRPNSCAYCKHDNARVFLEEGSPRWLWVACTQCSARGPRVEALTKKATAVAAKLAVQWWDNGTGLNTMQESMDRAFSFIYAQLAVIKNTVGGSQRKKTVYGTNPITGARESYTGYHGFASDPLPPSCAGETWFDSSFSLPRGTSL